MIVGDALLHWGYAARRSLLVALVVLVVLIIAACDNSVANAPKPSVTATPTLANVQHLSLGDFQASSLLPMAHGLLLFGTPGTVGHLRDVPPELTGKPTALYYYDFATQAVRRLVEISIPADHTIGSVAARGDWVVYSMRASFYFQWDRLLALNVVTHEQQVVATTSETRGIGVFTTDGQIIVWPLFISDERCEMHVYDLKAHREKTVLTIPEPLEPALLDVGILAINQGRILYYERYRDNPLFQNPNDPFSHDMDGTYLWTSSSPIPRHISKSPALNLSLSRHYAVWNDEVAQTLTLYDLQKNLSLSAWATSCIRPDIDASGSYVACLDYAHNLAVLIQVKAHERTTLGDAVDNSYGAIANGLVYWLVRKGTSLFGNEVDAWPLPAA